MKKIFFFSVLIIFIAGPLAFGQKHSADSLSKLIPTLSGEKKVDAINELADIYYYIDTKKSIEYAEQGLALAKKMNYQKGIAANYGTLGFSYVNVDNTKAIEYTNKALEIRNRINDKSGQSNSLNMLGVIHYYMGEYLIAFDYHIKALKLREEIGDKFAIATSYNHIALVLIALDNYDEAMESLQKGLKLVYETGDEAGAGIINDNIGRIYVKKKEYGKANQYFRTSLKINQEIGNTKSEANSYFNIAEVYKEMQDTVNAFKHYLLASAIYYRHDEKNGIANVENGLAELYYTAGKSQPAIEHAITALKYAKLINSLSNISKASDILQKEYFRLGDLKNAYYYLSLYDSSKDSLINADKIIRLSRKEFNYRVEMVKKEQEGLLERQKLYIYVLLLTVLLLVTIFILIYFSYRQKRKTNNSLNLLNEQLMESNTTKDRFFSIIAHDLKSPFLGLMGYSQILSEDYSLLKEDERKTYISNIHELTKSTYKLLENLLEWSRLQTGKMEFKPEKCNVYEVLSPTIDLLEKTAQNKRIAIKEEIDKRLEVKADIYMLQTVVRNLISNSIKFTKPNGGIFVKAERNDSRIIISVKDDGVGMNKTVVDTLFKIDKTTSTKGTVNEEGTGLGLFLCKEMVDRHKGTIWVESAEGEGSTFFIELPAIR
jgi:signal transduction histidine kinase